MRHSLAIPLALFLGSCGKPDEFLPPNGFATPAGVLSGSITYTGPLPCTEHGRIVGNAVLLAFDSEELPPPEGIGTSAASLNVVTGEDLFSSIRDRLTFSEDGSRTCPQGDGEKTTVSHDWVLSPLPGATYEVRGFYDLDGNFDPSFSISNLPTRGDVAGGAIENVVEASAGAKVEYRQIELGQSDADGSRFIPAEGALVSGIAVTLGAVLPLERPVFHLEAIADPNDTSKDDLPTMASDFQLGTFSSSDPVGTEASFLKLTFGAGTPEDEDDAAKSTPLLIPQNDGFFYSRADENGDGVRDALDHIPDSTLIPSLSPITIFSRRANDGDRHSLVLIQGITVYESLLKTATSSPDLSGTKGSLTTLVRPAAICLDPDDPNARGALVVSREADTHGHPIVPDQELLLTGLSAKFGREFDLVYGCLPQGTYLMNVIYETGQAWTIPNEAGTCAPSEALSKDGLSCGTRPRLLSQAPALTIGAPKNSSYCAEHPTPALCR